MPTPLATATCCRSATSPSLTSTIAVAPSSAARGPCAYGGSGRRCAATTLTGERNPRPSTASPAAAQPSRPVYATTSPGLAPDRVTGARPCRSPNAVTASTSTSARTTSPPSTRASSGRHSARIPSASSSSQATGRSGGTARPSSRPVGTAPMAATSARFCAAALRPTSVAVDQSRRKCLAVDEQVGGGHHPAVRRRQHRRVVARPEHRLGADPAANLAVSRSIRPNSPTSATVMASNPLGPDRSGRRLR